MRANATDLACGAVFIVFGLFWGYLASRMQVGTALRMGPGYFPLVVSGCIVAVGVLIAGKALFAGRAAAVGESERSEPLNFSWRAMVLLTLAPIVFALMIRQVGLVPSVAVVAGLSFFASRRARLLPAVSVTVCITLLCMAIFHYGLGLPIPLFSWN